MKSIINSSEEVKYKNQKYLVEADVTIEGTPLFTVTNLQTMEKERCLRKGNKAKINTGMMYDPSDDMINILRSTKIKIEFIDKGK